MQNISQHFVWPLFRGKNFNRPIGRQVKVVWNVTLWCERDPIPLKDRHIRADRSPAKTTSQFWEGIGKLGCFCDVIDGGTEFSLQAAMSSLWYGFLNDFTINIFTCRFGFWQLQKFCQCQWFGERLYHSDHLQNSKASSMLYSNNPLDSCLNYSTRLLESSGNDEAHPNFL